MAWGKGRVSMNDVLFRKKAIEQYLEWLQKDRAVFDKITRLIEEAGRTPFRGTGKPEPLKGSLGGCWSRRITDEHRLIYRVKDHALEILSCMGHYED